MEHKNAVDVVENLIETCKDGENGYRDAAEHVKRPDLKTLFLSLSLERSKFAGELQAGKLRFAIAAARFNDFVVDRLVDGAVEALKRQGASESNITVARVPGAFELPVLVKKLAASGRYDAVIALGAVIRGATAHFDFVAGEAARGIADAARDTGVPVIFGVLTTESVEQALERASPERMDKGGEAMDAALEMARRGVVSLRAACAVRSQACRPPALLPSNPRCVA